MKKITKIYERIKKSEERLSSKKNEYSNLDQISFLSREGQELDEEINQLKGEIRALYWVLKQS